MLYRKASLVELAGMDSSIPDLLATALQDDEVHEVRAKALALLTFLLSVQIPRTLAFLHPRDSLTSLTSASVSPRRKFYRRTHEI